VNGRLWKKKMKQSLVASLASLHPSADRKFSGQEGSASSIGGRILYEHSWPVKGMSIQTALCFKIALK
jgi:hypothetical protein